MEMGDDAPVWDIVGRQTPKARPLRHPLGDGSFEGVPGDGLAFKLEAMLFNQLARSEDCVFDGVSEIASLVQALQLIPLSSRIAPAAPWTDHAFPAREGCCALHARDIGVREDWSGLEREWRFDMTGPFDALVQPDRIEG